MESPSSERTRCLRRDVDEVGRRGRRRGRAGRSGRGRGGLALTAAAVMMVMMAPARLLHLLHLLLQRREVLLRFLHIAGLQVLPDLIQRLRKRIVRIPIVLAAEGR